MTGRGHETIHSIPESVASRLYPLATIPGGAFIYSNILPAIALYFLLAVAIHCLFEFDRSEGELET